jgi:hypothetical protein
VRILLSILMLLLPVGLLTAADSDDLTKIRIQVFNLQEKPIDQASVVVRFVKGRSLKKLGGKMMTNWEVRTNKEGWADIPAIPRGDIRLQIIAKGYQTYGDLLNVDEAEKTIKINLKPPQSQFTSHQ